VLEQGGDGPEADARRAAAVELLERKGDIVTLRSLHRG
jgi:hypothetical protein